MIDASHSNSHKICREQINVVNNICEQVSGGNSSIIGVMIESNLVEGNQKIEPDKPLVYGQSVTDACLGWDDTVVLLNNTPSAIAAAVSSNRNVQKNSPGQLSILIGGFFSLVSRFPWRGLRRTSSSRRQTCLLPEPFEFPS